MGGSLLKTFGNETDQQVHVYSFARNKIWSFTGDIQSFSDSYSANVNQEAVYGRIDQIKTYSGTTREISFSIKIESETQTSDFFTQVKLMASTMYPVYDTGNLLIDKPNILKAPPLYAVKCSPLLVGGYGAPSESNMLPGFFTSFGIDYNTTDGVEVNDAESVPREITLNFSFSPLHDRMGGFNNNNVPMSDKSWPF